MLLKFQVPVHQKPHSNLNPQFSRHLWGYHGTSEVIVASYRSSPYQYSGDLHARHASIEYSRFPEAFFPVQLANLIMPAINWKLHQY
jgi:hypothetical protein